MWQIIEQLAGPIAERSKSYADFRSWSGDPGSNPGKGWRTKLEERSFNTCPINKTWMRGTDAIIRNIPTTTISGCYNQPEGEAKRGGGRDYKDPEASQYSRMKSRVEAVV